MKKSEAVNLMLYYWKQLNDPTSKYSIELSLDTKMKYLLEGLEGAGMLPPVVEKYKKINPLNVLGEGFKVKSKVNEWEPEDETK